jgi:hypothetical protein
MAGLLLLTEETLKVYLGAARIALGHDDRAHGDWSAL